MPKPNRAAIQRARARSRARLRAFLAFLGYVGLAGLFLMDALRVGGAFLLRDLLTFFHPWQSAVAAAWRSGAAPFWNPDTLCGVPLLANLQTGTFYPINWLYVVLPFDAALTTGMAIHLVLAATLMRSFLRRVDLGQTAAFAGGLMFGFGLWTVSYLEFPMKLGAAVWLPLLWSGIWDAMIYHDRRGLVRGGAAIALSLLAGYPQLTFFGLGSAALLAIFLAGPVLREKGLTASARFHRLGAMPVALLLGALVAAVQLVPAATMTSLSAKAAPYDATVAMTRSLPPKNLVTMLDPFLFGFPGVDRYWGGEIVEFCFGAMFVSVVGLVLAFASAPAFLKLRRHRRITKEDLERPMETPIVPRVIPFFLLTGLVLGIVLSLGRFTPIYPLLHEWVPGFGRSRWPSTAGYLVAVHLAALAAVGLQALVREPKRYLFPSIGALAAGAVFIVLWAVAQGPLAGSLRDFLLAGAPEFQRAAWDHAMADWRATLPLRAALPLIAGMVGLSLGRRFPHAATVWTVLIAADLFLAARALETPAAKGFYDTPPENAAAVREQLDGQRLYTPRSVDQLGNFLYGCRNPVAFEWAKRAMLCNANVPRGIAQANGCEPLGPRRHDAFSQVFDDPSTPHEIRERIFDLWDAAALVEVEGVRPLDIPTLSNPAAGIRLNPHTPGLARASVLSGWSTPDDPEALLSRLLSADHDPARVTLLEIPDGATPPASPQRNPRSRFEAVENARAPNRITAAWQIGDGGMLRILETWDPGWTATVNGRPAPVYRADFAFLAVPVPDGSVEVELRYEPPRLRIGLAGTGLGLLGLLAFWIAERIARKRRAALAAQEVVS